MCTVPLVTLDRQPWHGTVEQEVCDWLDQGAGGTIDDVVKAVLARDSAYPHDLVRRNLVYILATASGRGDGHRAGARTGWPARSPSYFQNSVSKFGPPYFCPKIFYVRA